LGLLSQNKRSAGPAGEGLAFQLRGMPSAFYYSGEERVNINSSRSKNGEQSAR
jgi:hypothetical protein